MIVRVGINAPSREDFLAHLGGLIQAGALPAALVGHDGNMLDSVWGIDDLHYIAYGGDHAFVETPEVLGADLVPTTPAVLYSGFTIIIEATAAMLGITNTGTVESPVYESDESVIPSAWLNMDFIDQLVRG